MRVQLVQFSQVIAAPTYSLQCCKNVQQLSVSDWEEWSFSTMHVDQAVV